MSDTKVPSCLRDAEVQAALAHLHERIKDIPAHHRPIGGTRVVLISYYHDEGREVLDGGYISASGMNLASHFDVAGSIDTVAVEISSKQTDVARWQHDSPEVLDASVKLAESLGSFNRGTMIDHLLIVAPNRESGLSPLAFFNDRPWDDDPVTLSEKILGLLSQATDD